MNLCLRYRSVVKKPLSRDIQAYVLSPCIDKILVNKFWKVIVC